MTTQNALKGRNKTAILMSGLQSYVSAETLKGHDSGTKTEDTTPKSRPGESNYGSEGSMGRCSRVAAAFLGLLCLLVLAGIMVLFVYYNGVTVLRRHENKLD